MCNIRSVKKVSKLDFLDGAVFVAKVRDLGHVDEEPGVHHPGQVKQGRVHLAPIHVVAKFGLQKNKMLLPYQRVINLKFIGGSLTHPFKVPVQDEV